MSNKHFTFKTLKIKKPIPLLQIIYLWYVTNFKNSLDVHTHVCMCYVCMHECRYVSMYVFAHASCEICTISRGYRVKIKSMLYPNFPLIKKL